MITTQLERLFDYQRYRDYLRNILPDGKSRRLFERHSSRFFGYPENHNYYVYDGHIVPTFKLYERFRKVSDLYAPDMDSLLDISCCRGFYVLDACARKGLKRSVGIDVVDRFVNECNAISLYAGETGARFLTATLDEIHETVKSEGTPYHTTLCLGSYHYFFWGSGSDNRAWFDHDEILQRLADITAHQVIFSGRLELEQLTPYPRKVAVSHPKRDRYSTAQFLKSARRYFDIRERGYLGRSVLYQLIRK